MLNLEFSLIIWVDLSDCLLQSNMNHVFVSLHDSVSVLALILLARYRDKEVAKTMSMNRAKTRRKTNTPSKELSIVSGK